MHNTLTQPQTAVPLELAAFQEVFNKELAQFLDSKYSEYQSIPNASIFLEALEHARTLLLSGGKRIRPYICYLSYVTEQGKSEEEVFRIGIALELFHLFALVHDDIIDHGLTRHGIPTTQVFVASRINTVVSRDIPHIADGIALLIGDLLFSWSYEIMSSSHTPEATQLFAQMVSEVVAGQALDVSFMLRSVVSSKEIAEKNELKTARYTFVNPMQIGRSLAKSTAHTDTYTSLGLALGQAFQIQDDLLDIIGTAARTGKEPFIDVEDGQHTLLTQYVFEHGSPEDQSTLRSVFRRKLSGEERALLGALFVSTGAIDYARSEIETLLEQAGVRINELPESSRSEWYKILALLSARVS